jgi:hypothetical protein
MLSPVHPTDAVESEWNPLTEAIASVERGWAEGRWGGLPLPAIPAMSIEQLEQRKRNYKHALRKYESRFEAMHGNPPTATDKKVVKPIYRMHKALRSEIEARSAKQ